METSPRKIRRALISVTDKTGLEELARGLHTRNIQILSSGGTAQHLRERGIPVTEVSDFTGAPELLDGRLKTLHPKIHGGILAVRENPAHAAQLQSQGYLPIDLVVVNLYPFEQAVADGLPPEKIVENIDIGGPTLLRSAAKNHADVTALTDPSQYGEFLNEIKIHEGGTSLLFRRKAARRVFERTAAYDSAIAAYFQRESADLPDRPSLALELKWPLRYGENPHQKAGFYLPAGAKGETVLERVLQGKQLSYNNLMDVHAALDLIAEFPGAICAAILKHTNPCGVGLSEASLCEAYRRALAGDPVSAFGGVVVVSKELDGETARLIGEVFTEIVIAPCFRPEALEILGKKKNLRLLEVNLAETGKARGGFDIRRAADGYLVQERDGSSEDLSLARLVTKSAPSGPERSALALAWRVVKHVKSNAIVLSSPVETLGIGAGQMSRVDSSRIAATKAAGKKPEAVVLASDAFFPFRDSIDEAARFGVRAIVQPGGSIRDEEVIAAADEHGIAMLFTDVRHFRH